MKYLPVLFAAVFFSSCIHMAVSPVANPQGVPVVIRVPGVKAGQEPTTEQIKAIDAWVDKDLAGQNEAAKPDPAIIGAGTVGMVGDVTSKRGENFVGYLPMIFIRSTHPPEVVERGTAQVAAAYYRSAKKRYQLYAVTDLKSQPKKAKP